MCVYVCRPLLWQLGHCSLPILRKFSRIMSSNIFFSGSFSFCSSGTPIIWRFSSVQSLSRVRLFATPWIATRQASLSITNSRSSLRLTSVESVMPSSHLILCHPLLLLPLIPPSIRVFSNELTLRMRWPKYWSFSFSIVPSKEIPGLSASNVPEASETVLNSFHSFVFILLLGSYFHHSIFQLTHLIFCLSYSAIIDSF